MDARKQTLVNALRVFIRQRPGLEYANYGDPVSYRAESRSITKDGQQARELLDAVVWRSITADELLKAARDSFSGRLSITETEPGRFVLDYCTGQYFPTEYRRAACAVLSSALWAYWRENGHATGDDIRKTARRELGRSLARWFH